MSQEVEVKIKVDTAKAVTDVNKLGDAFDNTAQDAQDAQKVFSKAGNGVEVEQSIAGLKQLKRELKNTAVGSAEFKKLYNDIDDLEDKLKSAKNTSSDWVDSLEQAGGPLGMVGAAINKAKVATQSFGGALKATGIGLIVSLLGGLAVAFSDNEGAMKKIQPLLDGIGKIFQGVFRSVEPLFNTLVDLAINALPMVSKAFAVVYSSVTSVFQSLGKIGGAIGKLISGDFSGAWQDAKSSVNDFGKNYDASIKRFNEGTKEITKVEKKESKTRVKIKKETNDELDKLEQERLAKQMASAEEAMNKEKQLREAQETPAEREEREYQEWLSIYQANNLNTELLDKEHKDNLALIAKDKADKQKEIDDKEAEDKKDKAEKENEEKLSLIEFDLENDAVTFEAKKQLILDREALLLQDQTLTESEKKRIHKESVDAQIAVEQAKFQAQQILLAKTSETLDKGADLLGKNTAAGKSMAVASALINTYQGITAELATKTVTPFEIGLKVANVAVIAATGFKAVKNILAVKTPGGGGGGGAGGSMGGISAPASAQPSINVVGASKTNAIAETIAQQGQQPIKAYVVANDVTTQQGLDRNIVSSASIG